MNVFQNVEAKINKKHTGEILIIWYDKDRRSRLTLHFPSSGKLCLIFGIACALFLRIFNFYL
jgi:hypothetical protein